MKKTLTGLLFFALFIVLAINILNMPGEIGLLAPSYNETSWYYIDNSVSETGAVNIIAAVLTDYRSFDTLGETIVLFTSIVAVHSILLPAKKKEEETEIKEINHG
ncbi:MAG: hydrogen gas-evolving membrane-bound hydrogenase subunit E [Acholeplasmataceae bacterium]